VTISEFGLRNRELREKSDVSLRTMATEIKFSAAYLSSVEIGEKPVTDELLDRVANFYRKLGRKNSEIATIFAAADRSRKAIDVSALDGDSRQVVAAFAKRLSDMDRDARERFLKKIESSLRGSIK
jgi:transcriptional regulator with XRE-family HTH domain